MNRLKNRVLRYLCEHPNVTEDDIAEALNLHVVDVLSALVLLEEEGKVKGLT